LVHATASGFGKVQTPHWFEMNINFATNRRERNQRMQISEWENEENKMSREIGERKT